MHWLDAISAKIFQIFSAGSPAGRPVGWVKGVGRELSACLRVSRCELLHFAKSMKCFDAITKAFSDYWCLCDLFFASEDANYHRV